MPPRGAPKVPDRFYELGEQGRKTGVTLPNTGAPDEHGLQPLDGIFSSPTKGATPGRPDQTGELDMELDDSGPGPSTILAAQKSSRMPIPKARSPLKTNLQSPALRNPHVGPTAIANRGSLLRRQESPEEADDDHTVTRKLDYRKTKLNGMRGASKINGAPRRTSRAHDDHDDDDDDGDDSLLQDNAAPGIDDSVQLVDDMSPVDDPVDDTLDQEEEQEEEEEVRPKPRRRGRPPKARPAAKPVPIEAEESPEVEDPAFEDDHQSASPPQRKRGRPAKKPTAAPSKRRERDSPDEDSQEVDDRSTKRQKTQARPAKATGKGAGKKPGRPARAPQPQNQEDPDESVLQVQRGPPLPKGRGLVSQRRDPNAVTQTRSGRHSYKPLDYWKGEHIIHDRDDAHDDMFRPGNRILLPSIKEIVRVEEAEEDRRRKATRRPRAKAGGGGRRRARDDEARYEEEEEEPEEWELGTGVISGDVVLWEPEHEIYPPGTGDPVEMVEDQLAVSSDAILTKDIHDATFRFAKTMNLSFMGAGVVDLPPGAEKKPKNSRKMQMVFFVFSGKVVVTVNETEFRITAGGQWFVPRGNYYSIKNDYDRPARIFFAQACEVMAQPSLEV